METKKLISIRLSEKLLKQLDDVCSEHNKKDKFVFYDNVIHYRHGYKSRADVIEDALRQFFATSKK